MYGTVEEIWDAVREIYSKQIVATLHDLRQGDHCYS